MFTNSYLYSFHTLIIHILNIHFSIILPSILRLSNNSFTLRFSYHIDSTYNHLFLAVGTSGSNFVYIFTYFLASHYFHFAISN